jgi:hypothetical protein
MDSQDSFGFWETGTSMESNAPMDNSKFFEDFVIIDDN